MSPRKEPDSLFKICVKASCSLINSALYEIEKHYPGVYNKTRIVHLAILYVSSYLRSLLPVSLFDVLCSNRKCRFSFSDARNQLLVFTHPKMTVFRCSNLDKRIPLELWLAVLPQFTNLTILDLAYICCDEMLEPIGNYCRQLQEINIISNIDNYIEFRHSLPVLRNVSDEGLKSVANLKKLKVLTMDPPRNPHALYDRPVKTERCISENGIILLISVLPCLEELIIDPLIFDVGSSLVNTRFIVEPSSLRKVHYQHGTNSEGIKKLARICPDLTDLSVTNLAVRDFDDILKQISVTKLRLNRLELSFFTFTVSLHRLLSVKGSNLTDFSISDLNKKLHFDAILWIGKYCPHLNTLSVITESPFLIIPKNFEKPPNMFSELQMLTIGNVVNFKQLLSFFLNGAKNLQRLVVKSQMEKNFDSTLVYMLYNGYLRNIHNLWLDRSLEVSISVVKNIIELCENLRMLTVDLMEDSVEINGYIHENNLDLKLGRYEDD